MHRERFIVIWTRRGSNIGFQADHYAMSPREARRMHLEMFPGDRVCGVKRPRSDGRWVA